MADFANRFERLELKYLITEDVADRIREAILPYVKPDKFNGRAPSGGYHIYNLYLDTPDYTLHRVWRRGDSDRFKLRIRTYDPIEGPAFLEVKRKVVDVIAKIRVAVDRGTLEDACLGFGQPLKPNPDQWSILGQFAYFVARTGARPVCCVHYEREAFMSTCDRYARVTFDRRVRAQRMTDWTLCGDTGEDWLKIDDPWLFDGLRSATILELKCETQVPMWMSNIIRGFQLKKKGFSKYGFGIEEIARRESGRDVAWLKEPVYA